SRDLILDAPLPNPFPPTGYIQVEIVKMDASGAAVAGQTGSGARVNAGTMADLRRLDGLAIENVGGAPATVERRIVTQVFLSCPVAALPNALHATAIAVDLMSPDAATRAGGTVSTNTRITTTPGEAGRFSIRQPVRVRKAPGTDFFTTLAGVDNAADRLTLDDPLPAGDFPNTTAVTVHLMTAIKRFEAEPSPAPGTQVTVKVDRPGSPAQSDVIRVRTAAAVQGGALRQVTAAPTVAAELDSALPGTHTNNLTVQRLTPVANTLKQNASAPLVQLRFDFTGGHTFVVGDELHLLGGEEAWGKVHALTAAGIELEEPVEFALVTTGIAVQRVVATGKSTADAALQESLILVPSQLDEEPITRRRAVEFHEMRHVWQYAVLGPFFFSFPLPWLIHLGFSFTDKATSEYKWVRHFSVGAVDSLFAVIVWGVGAMFGADPDGADENGEITDTERKVITLPSDTDPAKVAAYTEGSPCEVVKGDYTTFNIIEGLDTGQKKISLRFALESDKFAVNDRVRLSVSPFDKIRSTVNKWFSLNLERLWSDHIPVSWGRALSSLLNRDSWFPLLGLYPIGLAMAGFDQSRMHFEQDASFHSGDVYTQFSISEPSEIFVGQFCRAYGFFMGRGAGDRAVGLSDADVLEFLTVTPPAIGGTTPTELVFGS
ncbi:MAG TPA: hypothetical protein VLT88_08745, partial [Desulfosarcina sp.]|nr:hypothetical protein [Desulfosarcina sp.]